MEAAPPAVAPRSETGVGNGLVLVPRLLSLHGGRMTAASAGTGQGRESVVRLPLAT
jgi:K+-sensing histidine kinase KdpD